MRKTVRRALLASLTFAMPLHAQTTTTAVISEPAAAPAAAVTAPAPEAERPCCTIPALTPVTIEVLSTVNSQANKIGEKFAIRLAEPIVIEGKTVVPAGATGSGDVVHAAKSRFGGKPGELIIAVRYLEHLGQKIPLRSLSFSGATGKDNGRIAEATGVAVGMLSMFITGGEVNIAAGTRGKAKVAAETTILDRPNEGGTTP